VLGLFLLLVQDPSYDTRTLEIGGRADKLVARDLDGDSFPDLIVQNGRDLHVFLFDRAKGFTPAAQQVLRLDGTVFLWTVAALEKGRPPSLVTEGSRAIQSHGFANRAFVPKGADLVIHPSLFEGLSADGKAPPFQEFAPDFDGDGAAELLLFEEDEVLVLKRHASGDYRCLQKLPIPMDVNLLRNWGPHQKMIEATSVPVLSFGDTDGDGRRDLSYYRDESVGVFRQEPSGLFKATDSMDLTTHKSKRRDRFFKFEIPPKVADVNGDGLLDIALVYPSKGRLQIYYGQAGRRDFSEPDQTMNVTDGWSTGIYLEDLDGDGKLDLVMGVVRKLGITDGIQVFLSGKVDLELHVFPMQASGRFTKDPVREIKFTIPYSFQVTRTSASLDLVFRPNFKGDFNRDGLRDLLVAVDGRTMAIYPGVRGSAFRDKPEGKIEMNPPAGTSLTEPFVTDFNQDGVSDLVLRHVAGDGKSHTLELKLSK
jgi:hypothetical protein